MVELVAKEIVRNLLIVFLLVLAMFIAWDQSRAATLDLTLPSGDYMLVPVQPYTVVTIQSQPVDPPVEPPVEPPVDQPVDQPVVVSGTTVGDCIAQLTGGGFCQIPIDPTPVFRDAPGYEKGTNGMLSAWDAYTGAAWDWPYMYLHGGGHANGGMIDILRFDWETGELARVYTPPPMNNLVEQKKSDETVQYGMRHDDSLPESTHTYDGILFDPDTGLVIVNTGEGNRIWQGNADGFPLPTEFVNAPTGVGIYAWNPTDVVVKGIAPKAWGKVSDFDQPLPASAYLGNGEYAIGSSDAIYKARWVGSELFVDLATRVTVSKGDAPNLHAANGKLYRINARYADVHNVETLALEHRIPVDLRGRDTQFSLETYGEKILFWNGKWTVRTLDMNGNWELFDYDVGDPMPRKAGVWSKWIKHPQHDDIYVGWSAGRGNPVVYRHDPAAGVPLAEWQQPGISEQIATAISSSDGVSPVVVTIEPGDYLEGAKISTNGQPLDIDFSGATRIERQAGNGTLELSGGPITIRNLKDTNLGRSSLWVLEKTNWTLIGCEIARKNFGVITSKSGGTAHVENCIIRDGTSTRPGYEHNLYIGKVETFTARNLESLRNDKLGHLLKSRAKVNVIENSVFDGDKSRHSRVLDFPCRSQVVLRNVTGIQSPNADNADLIAIDVESDNNCPYDAQLPPASITFDHVRFVANRQNARLITTKAADLQLTCVGENEFIGVENPC